MLACVLGAGNKLKSPVVQQIRPPSLPCDIIRDTTHRPTDDTQEYEVSLPSPRPHASACLHIMPGLENQDLHSRLMKGATSSRSRRGSRGGGGEEAGRGKRERERAGGPQAKTHKPSTGSLMRVKLNDPQEDGPIGSPHDAVSELVSPPSSQMVGKCAV